MSLSRIFLPHNFELQQVLKKENPQSISCSTQKIQSLPSLTFSSFYTEMIFKID